MRKPVNEEDGHQSPSSSVSTNRLSLRLTHATTSMSRCLSSPSVLDAPHSRKSPRLVLRPHQLATLTLGRCAPAAQGEQGAFEARSGMMLVVA